jgi:alpha-N-arabinofuranosidase
VKGANIAQMINVLQAMIMTDQEKMVLTPSYYVYKLYVPFQNATFVPVNFNAGNYSQGNTTLPRIDAIAARDMSGKVWVEITNLDPNQPIEVSVAGMAAKSATGETLTAPKVDSVNTFAAPRTVVTRPFSTKAQSGKLTLKLDPKSVTVVSLEQ